MIRSEEGLADFQQEVRAFCRAELPPDLHRRVLQREPIEKQAYLEWQRRLDDQGWFAGHWPVQFGGQDWSKLKRWVFEQELDRAGAPWLMPFGVTYVGPIIFTFGNDEQQARYLPKIRRSEEWWAQGYSEPGAGSDLAHIQTRAERRGDVYIVNGQKIWTTYAHWADLMFTLVRTSNLGAPQSGISFLLMDLSAPGVSVRPIRSIDGDHHLNEVFLEDVSVPAANLIGAENEGWTFAKHLLVNERLLTAEVGKAKRMIAQFRGLLAARDGMTTNSYWRTRLAEVEINAIALEATCLDLLGNAEPGSSPGPEASLLKILGSELLQQVSGMTVELLQSDRLRLNEGSVREYLYGRAATIYGGSSEVQRNIMAKAFLGL